MINKKFKALEHVNGLKSIIAVSRADNRIQYKSESVSDDDAAALVRNLSLMLNASSSNVSHISINFILGRVLGYILKDHLLILSVDDKFDVNALRNAMKNASHKVKDHPKVSTGALQQQQGTTISAEQQDTLISTVATLLEQAQEELGLFSAVNLLKEARQELKISHPYLLTVSISKKGELSAGDSPTSDIPEVARAMAAFCKHFFTSCDNVIPTFPPELALSLLESNRKELTKLGFYDAWLESD